MSNPGRALEDLVKRFEDSLAPSGFKVTTRERVYNEKGEQIAELDVLITGEGKRWLIECRDRPSEGPAPVAWIEQLVGRRRRLGFDRVFAISTTGFS